MTIRLAVLFVCLVFCRGLFAQSYCDEFDGAQLFSQEDRPVYLGFLGTDFASDSVFNAAGDFGSAMSPTSIFNVAGRYGSAHGAFSAFNDLASRPPVIVVQGRVIGYLSSNTEQFKGYTLEKIQALCPEFTAAFPGDNLRFAETGPGGFDTSVIGTWYDPARDGEGVFIDFIETAKGYVMWAYFASYDTVGNPIYLVGADESYDPEKGIFEAEVVTTSGARWGEDYSSLDVVRSEWGTLTITFLACDWLELEYESTLPEFGSGTMILEKYLVSTDEAVRPGVTCP